jgi:ABC-type phosphate transport system substrate-binding protein
MKTFKSHSKNSKSGQKSNHIAKSAKNILVSLLLLVGTQSYAQNNEQVISISGTEFTSPLIKRWITEYSKINPGLKFHLINDQEKGIKSDLQIIAHTPDKGEISENKTLVKIARVAILPIINEKNILFAKEFKRGIKQERLKAIFTNDQDKLDSVQSKAKEPEYTVYTKSPQSSVAKVLSSYLGKQSEDLKGIYISGDDLYLNTSILDDSTGISYNNLGLIYDLDKRIPISGIRILPIDLNNNGRLDKEELLYSNLDQVITYLENTKNTAIPTDNVSFVTDKRESNQAVANFVNWVKGLGQEYNHQYGFLNNTIVKDYALTQK